MLSHYIFGTATICSPPDIFPESILGAIELPAIDGDAVFTILPSDIFPSAIDDMVLPAIDIGLSIVMLIMSELPEQLPVVHFVWSLPEHISHVPLSDCIDTIDGSDIVATAAGRDLIAPESAATPTLTPPTTTNTATAIFFQLLFIFVTLYSHFDFRLRFTSSASYLLDGFNRPSLTPRVLFS
jgi:hypothetical protein